MLMKQPFMEVNFINGEEKVHCITAGQKAMPLDGRRGQHSLEDI
jgi:hypothetical protein